MMTARQQAEMNVIIAADLLVTSSEPSEREMRSMLRTLARAVKDLRDIDGMNYEWTNRQFQQWEAA